MDTIEQRTDIGRALIARGTGPDDVSLAPAGQPPLARRLPIPFPDGLAPTPALLAVAPDPAAALPHADVVVITWTIDEQDALADVLTPGFSRKTGTGTGGGSPSTRPHPGGRALASPRGGWGATSRRRWERLGPVLQVRAAPQPGREETGEGTATLPVKDLFDQIIDEVQPGVVLTVGTSGSVFDDFHLGDVGRDAGGEVPPAVRVPQREAFNGVTYRTDWRIPTDRLADALALMEPFGSASCQRAALPPADEALPLEPRTRAYPDPNVPDIKMEQDARDMPEFHPILTTDYFEFGTSANHLESEGAAVEMGDAVLGLAMRSGERPPQWAVVRNMSDPQINGDIPADGIGWTRRRSGRSRTTRATATVTSVTGALATWGILAGLSTP